MNERLRQDIVPSNGEEQGEQPEIQPEAEPQPSSPDVKHVILPPISEAERDKLRAESATAKLPSKRGLIPGPNGQMISGGRKAGKLQSFNDK